MSQLLDDVWWMYKCLLLYVKFYVLILFVSFIGYVIYVGIQVGVVQLVGYLGEIVVNLELYWVVIVFIVLFFIVLVQGIGQFMGSYLMIWVVQEIVYWLCNDVFGYVLCLLQLEYNNNVFGCIMLKIIFDVQQIISVGIDVLIVMLCEGFIVIGLFIFLLYQNWKLMLILLIVVFLVGLVVNFISK